MTKHIKLENEGPPPPEDVIEMLIIECNLTKGTINVKAPQNHITALGMIEKAKQILGRMWEATDKRALEDRPNIIVPKGPLTPM